MYILGLTGSIGMGKSWAGRCFRTARVPVHDADAAVHALLSPGGAAVRLIDEAFPGVLDDAGGVDRLKLGAKVLGDDAKLTKLEGLLHPLVRADQRKFLKRCRARGVRLVVLDIPLLFETQGRSRVDAVVVMSAPRFVQEHRVLKRAGMTRAKFDAILARQMDDAVKRRLADFIVATGATRGDSFRQIAAVAKTCKHRAGRVWSPTWGH